jgi:hypothetical protein
MVTRGIDRAIAAQLAATQGPAMGKAILAAFYRSAAQPAMARLGQNPSCRGGTPRPRRHRTEDRLVGSEEMRHRSAARAAAQTATLDGLAHWWMVQDPVASARALTSFWE